MKACVLIPTYNEAKTIGKLITAIESEGFDVLVVDDGSKDDTASIARNAGAVVIEHKINRGKGASLKAGFAYVLENGYDIALIMDGDGQHNPKDIKRFIKASQSTGADLIIGNRMQDTKSMPPIRWLTNKWMSGFISKLCGQHIPDSQCGFRLIKRRVIERIKLVSSKYDTESEILIRAGKKNFKLSSIPIKSIYNGEASDIHPIKDALRFIRLVIYMWLERARR